MASGCLDEAQVLEFLGGTLSEAGRAEVAPHLASCGACAELVTWAAADLASRTGPSSGAGRPFVGRIAPGTRVDRYQILSALGRGGMGEVYAAYHPDLDRRIALKIMYDAGADSAERRALLLREARTIARLSHPNIISVYDAGTFDHRVYIAMEFVDGETVDAWLQSRTRGWREVLEVFIAAGRGLAAAHAAGVVHRDFKPQNVMIGRDGSIRVTDFGLARLTEEPADASDGMEDPTSAPAATASTTPTAATQSTLAGTPAYMAPEQFRRESLDTRADQFSFCVALYEALHGRRPALPHLPGATAAAVTDDGKTSTASRSALPPAWLRAVIARGLSADREQRFSSMHALLAAVDRGLGRGRRRGVALAVGVTVALLAVGGWRLATARRMPCLAPRDRLAAVWPAGDTSSPRRAAVHRAFSAAGHPNAESAWQRVARALDEYVTRWSAMHVQTCEATQVRGEQSGEVLDLRMTCLAETLDGVRALTDVLARADAQIVSQATSAVQELPPLSRCADVAALRAAIPPPRDEKVAQAVAALRGTLRDATALEEVGSDRAALELAREILPRAEATNYRPLLGEVLYTIGALQSRSAPADAEKTLELALFTAEASRDDVTAAKAAAGLVHLTAYSSARRRECDRWAGLTHAILDRLSTPQPRVNAWLLNSEAAMAMSTGDFASARRLLEQAIAIKEAALGKNHPDVVRSSISLVWTLTELGRPDEAVRVADRATESLTSVDPDNALQAFVFNNRGDALVALGRYDAAETDYLASLRILRALYGPTNYIAAHPLYGLGDARLRQGDVDGAVRHLEEALRLQEESDPDVLAVADTRFALARALGKRGPTRPRALSLATAARDTYAKNNQPRKQHDVDAWLGV